MPPRTPTIAVVGLAGRFPGSGADLDLYWQNIALARDCSREVPAGRWTLPASRCLDPRGQRPDSVEHARGYYLDPFTLDESNLSLPETILHQLDPLFHLILDVGTRAWKSAKLSQPDPRRVGVILGNICLPTDQSNALARACLTDDGTPMPHSWNRYVAGLPAGLLAKALGLGGGSFTLDAACASSLYAIKLACDELLSGRADVMLAGGASRPDCQYTQMGFSQLKALSPSGRCSPFDETGDGLMVGEGSGIFVLKRLEDAIKSGDTIHAVLRGWGLSNDTSGNLLAPSSEGQLRAMRAAYAMAEWKPSDVGLIECHATGTPVGDSVEFESLRTLWADETWKPGQCTIGSVKSSVGHLLTGAGSAALMKVILSLKNKMRPPQANFAQPGESLKYEDSPFRVLMSADPWKSETVRRAAVSAFGFGGINAHVLVEEYDQKFHTQKNANVTKGPLKLTTAKQATPEPAEDSTPSHPPGEPIAIVGISAHVGPWDNVQSLIPAMLAGSASLSIQPKVNGWGRSASSCPPGYYIEYLTVPLTRFRIPPKELDEMLPQQLLMLQVAAQAIDDSHAKDESVTLRTGTFIGLGLDLNTTNYHLRWSQLAKNRDVDDLPPLTADRTMGALGSIAASRIARAFHFGGPSFTCCSEETSSGTALQLAVRALRQGEIDRAVVGGVDLTGDPRQIQASGVNRPHSSVSLPFTATRTGVKPAEGAAACVLKRLSDAQRDGDRIYAVIRGIGAAIGGATDSPTSDSAAYATALLRACADGLLDPASIDLHDAAASGAEIDDLQETKAISAILESTQRQFPLTISASRCLHGHTGAASTLLSLVQTCLALSHRILPPGLSGDRIALSERTCISRKPRYWLADANEPRRASCASIGSDGTCIQIVLDEYETKENTPTIVERSEGLLTLEGTSASELIQKISRLRVWLEDYERDPIDRVARLWHNTTRQQQGRPLAVAFVPRSVHELLEQLTYTEEHLRNAPDRAIDSDVVDALPAIRDRVFFDPRPLGAKAGIAFVYPGSGNQYAGMGGDLALQFPVMLDRQQSENRRLRSQYSPERFWTDFVPSDTSAKEFLFGQVTLGTLVSDILVSLGIKPTAMVGQSLGESTGLFGTRVWTDRDSMYARIQTSTLFETDLGPPYNAARTQWGIPQNAPCEWLTAVIGAAPDDIQSRLRPGFRAYLLIINTPNECVIGGLREDVERLAASLNKQMIPLRGVTLAHCEAGKPVQSPYRQLHTLPVTSPAGLKVYSGAWGRSYTITSANAAESITAGLLGTINFPAAVNAAYTDGARVFIEVGPGNSCTRMIASILGERRSLVRSITAPRQDSFTNLLKLLANLAVERLPIQWDVLYPKPVAEPKPVISTLTRTVPVGMPYKAKPKSEPVIVAVTPPVVEVKRELVIEEPLTLPPLEFETYEPDMHVVEQTIEPGTELIESVITKPLPKPELIPAPTMQYHFDYLPVLEASTIAQSAVAEAHDVFLRVQHNTNATAMLAVQLRNELIQRLAGFTSVPPQPVGVPRSLTFEQCIEFAVGKIGNVLGPTFAEVDTHPTRVRLPEGPLMLVDRILKIEGEPKSMKNGRVITDHTVRTDRWYLDNGRCPTSVTVESGQADLFLSGFLGIDFITKGKAVYRLLDAVVTFHRELPRVGERIEYDIHIDEFFRQADSWLFRFRFEGTINGQPLLSMKNGVAGFFTEAALAAGQGIVHTKLDKQPTPGKKPMGWRSLAMFHSTTSLDAKQIQALHDGDLVRAFGEEFQNARLNNPMKLPSGMLKLVNRVPLLDPKGGRFSLGFVRAEYDIKPKEWFIECHFVDDKVMPGTLMYECCLHTLRTLLMRMGWVGNEGEVTCEPVPGIDSRLKCRGQVLDTTRLVTYEVSVKEIGYRPEPYCIADALMYADGKPIVEITNLSLRMSGLSKDRLEQIWSKSSPKKRLVYDSAKIMAYSNGKPSEGFGEPYRIFDTDRVIARLPGPPYQFLDGISEVTGEPFVLKEGASCVAEYAVPKDAWYFEANRCPLMPFSILLEVALQPCGWLAAYCGSALTSDTDLSFRNLGGQATQFLPVTPNIGSLTTKVTMTKVSKSAGMVIQHYDMLVTCDRGKVYEGSTYFGFFTKAALANQVGITNAKVPYLNEVTSKDILPHDEPFPDHRMRMVNRIDGYLPTGGAKGLGHIQGHIAVDPGFWFFKAHFYQDPVWPGSLGLESFLQLLKYVAWKRWGNMPASGWQTTALNVKHQWSYRGQVLPTDREVIVVLEVTDVDDTNRRLTANGFLTVDGRVIYQMTGFTLE